MDAPKSPVADNVHVNSPYTRGESAGRLNRGETHLSSADAKAYKAIDGTKPFPLGGAYPLPGTQLPLQENAFVFRRADQLSLPRLPGNPDGVMERAILLYRSGTTPRRDGGQYRALPATVTGPRSSAVFLDGSRGDIYGS